MILLIDIYDSFTFNLYQMMGEIEPDLKVIRNDAMTVEEIRELHPAGIILSPGPGRPENAGICQELVAEMKGEMPILGVCLGEQAICQVYGGKVGYASRLMHGKQSDAKLDLTSPLFRGLPETIKVARYHSLAVEADSLNGTELAVTSTTEDDGEVMAVEDRGRRVFGVQFHPESIMTPEGHKILQNFVDITKSGNILDQLADYARVRVAEVKKKIPLEEMKRKAESMPPIEGFPFEQALKSDGMSFICECKKASPSKGLIAPEFPYLDIAREYEAAGATAISCLTEPKWFQGSTKYLEEIAANVSIPVLRKDFTVDEYMIYEARVLAAKVILLICAILDDETLKKYIGIADSLGLSAIVEAHDEEEVDRAAAAGARIIGVNNRNLKDFTVDIHNSINLRNRVPGDVLFIAESGIRSREDIEELERGRVNGVLIGESLMRAPDKREALNKLRGE